jgi:pre-mRNA-processing factor 6
LISEAKAKRGEDDEEQFGDPDDESNLFAGTVYEADDAEADAIWESVESHMEGRRRARREAVEAAEIAKDRASNQKLDAKFADLKRGLSDVTDNEWENLPEVGDLTRRKRKANLRMQENGNGKSYNVSDTILAGAVAQNQTVNELDDSQMSGAGFETPAMQGTETDLVGIGQARDRVLSLQLDQASKDAAASGLSSTIDPRGYMTALNSQVLQSDAQIG